MVRIAVEYTNHYTVRSLVGRKSKAACVRDGAVAVAPPRNTCRHSRSSEQVVGIRPNVD